MIDELLLNSNNFMYPRLRKRGGVYCVEMDVPAWLRRKAWRDRIKLSLRTNDIDIALHRRELIVKAYSDFLTRMYKIPDLGWSDFAYAHKDFVMVLGYHLKLLNEGHSQTELS